ncbi:MAG: DUF805 domain-containing protein [Phenylobacterium sp.]|uniref:DUF805 domain-containing protein n=1 Tax=Phenylobacterium sp. TaxID=1871053 RepID=UPI0012270C52|nr:DUF805 domain-containing protein [Phenylobacterium sp.]TAJ73402.1 MAG: DUF805 domain-containing protein [Phenylobacterium sp.]
MTDQSLEAPRPRRMDLGAALRGRYDRKTYWSVLGGLFLVGLVVSLLGYKLGSATVGPMIFLMVRRLHDFDRSGWWSLAIVLGPLALMLALTPVASPEQTAPFIVLISLVWTIWLGSIPGDPHENRFGPAPGARDLKEVFG